MGGKPNKRCPPAVSPAASGLMNPLKGSTGFWPSRPRESSVGVRGLFIIGIDEDNGLPRKAANGQMNGERKTNSKN